MEEVTNSAKLIICLLELKRNVPKSDGKCQTIDILYVESWIMHTPHNSLQSFE
jgi:hypothetical protein